MSYEIMTLVTTGASKLLAIHYNCWLFSLLYFYPCQLAFELGQDLIDECKHEKFEAIDDGLVDGFLAQGAGSDHSQLSSYESYRICTECSLNVH
jgi:hypothetical protein